MELGTIVKEYEYEEAFKYATENGYTIVEIESTEEEVVETETYYEDTEYEIVVQEKQDAVYDEEGNLVSEAVEEVKEKRTEPVEKTRDVSKLVKVRQFKIVEMPQPSDEDIKQARINELKAKLSETDYIVIKIAEGEATPEEYSEVLANRKAWREEINKLQA